MHGHGRRLVGGALALCVGFALAACPSSDNDGFVKHSLVPGANPFDSSHPLWSPQPHRDHPYTVALSADGAKLYVTLQGVEDDPGNQVAVMDTTSNTVIRRINVGSSPTGIALHPGGRFVVVTNRFSNYASVIDTTSDRVVADVQVPYYTIDVAFSPDGVRAYFSNRWKDSVLRWDLSVGSSFKVVGDNYSHLPLYEPMGIAVGDNPRNLVVSADGERLYVAALSGLTLSIISTSTETESRRVDLQSPPAGLAIAGNFLFVSHTGKGTHHPPDEGYDTDGDGAPGDSTANVMFQDLQNEIAVFSLAGDLVHNYTSDTICCKDYRDVDPDNPTRGEAIPAPDTWPPSRVAFLPPRNTWIVACALPQQLAVANQQLIAVCSGSNEVQTFDIASDGALTPRQTAGELYQTGTNPYGIAVSPDGTRAFVAERLGEHISVLDLTAGPGTETRLLVGDIEDGEFPATDAEIGEAINFVTAPFTIDGDQTCVHCHREGSNLAKPVAMPLQGDTVWGVRMQMAYRGAFDTRPWFIESSMAETNFFPVINEFARKENFCCEQLDTLVWSAYPSASECLDSPDMTGCNHVLNCRADPPPECATRGYGATLSARNEHFKAGGMTLMGRDTTHGDALWQELLDDNGDFVRVGIELNFSGVTRAIGLFLLSRPRFLPNPNITLDLPAVRRGQRIYESSATGCSTCHPLPLTSVTTDFNPFAVPLRFPALVTPRLNPTTDSDADLVNALFLGTFPDTRQDSAGLHIGVPQLRGIWDRASRFLHDGRAHSLHEALATPGHPGLRDGEVGYNETYGMPDTHGATSHLTAGELDDLVMFLLSL